MNDVARFVPIYLVAVGFWFVGTIDTALAKDDSPLSVLRHVGLSLVWPWHVLVFCLRVLVSIPVSLSRNQWIFFSFRSKRLPDAIERKDAGYGEDFHTAAMKEVEELLK